MYKKGVEDFLEFAKRNGVGINGRYFCPCVNCVNGRRVDIELIREHILFDGFLNSYTTWTWHGEVIDLPYGSEADKSEYSNMYSKDCMEEMIRDIREENFQQTHVYDSLKDNSTTNLYPGCLSFSCCQQYYGYLILRLEMDGLIEVLLNCLSFCMKYFLKVIHCRLVTMRPRRYCVQWV